MINSYEVFLDDRQAYALQEALAEQNKPLENHLQKVVHDYYEATVPQEIQEKVNAAIEAERQELHKAAEAARLFTAIRIKESGQERHYEIDEEINALHWADMCRTYIRRFQDKPEYQLETHVFGLRSISQEDFALHWAGCESEYTDKRLTGILDINFDNNRFGIALPGQKLQFYRIEDTCDAVHHAFKAEPEKLSKEQRQEIFRSHLEGREIIAPARTLGQLLESGLSPNAEIIHQDGSISVEADTFFTLSDDGRESYKELLNATIVEMLPGVRGAQIYIGNVDPNLLAAYSEELAAHEYCKVQEQSDAPDGAVMDTQQ